MLASAKPGAAAEAVLFKYQALGNSYLVFDPLINVRVGKTIENAKSWIRWVCDHDYGVGSNGLLIGPGKIDDDGFEFRIFNSDGTQAEFSGNGSRIFARYVLDAGYADAVPGTAFSVVAVSPVSRVVVGVEKPKIGEPDLATDIHVAPMFGAVAVKARPESVRGDGLHVAVAALADIGRRHGLGEAWVDSTLVSIGNPHCVTFVDRLESLPSVDFLSRLRSELSSIADMPPDRDGPAFREGCNLQWCFVEDRKTLHLRIVERGEGPTLASGSSSSAAMIAAHARDLVGDAAAIAMPGGKLFANLLFDRNEIRGIRLTGRAERVAEVKVAAPT
jgi:diaminopimelate epimerase